MITCLKTCKPQNSFLECLPEEFFTLEGVGAFFFGLFFFCGVTIIGAPSKVRAQVFEDGVPRTDDLRLVLDEGLRSPVKRQQGGQVVACIVPRGMEHERRQSQSRSHSQSDITAATLGSRQEAGRQRAVEASMPSGRGRRWTNRMTMSAPQACTPCSCSAWAPRLAWHIASADSTTRRRTSRWERLCSNTNPTIKRHWIGAQTWDSP